MRRFSGLPGVSIGFAGAFRRPELVTLNVADVERVGGMGLLVGVRRPKVRPGHPGIRPPK